MTTVTRELEIKRLQCRLRECGKRSMRLAQQRNEAVAALREVVCITEDVAANENEEAAEVALSRACQIALAVVASIDKGAV